MYYLNHVTFLSNIWDYQNNHDNSDFEEKQCTGSRLREFTSKAKPKNTIQMRITHTVHVPAIRREFINNKLDWPNTVCGGSEYGHSISIELKANVSFTSLFLFWGTLEVTITPKMLLIERPILNILNSMWRYLGSWSRILHKFKNTGLFIKIKSPMISLVV